MGRFSANDLDVFILGPMARIARAAAAATKQFRPFSRDRFAKIVSSD